MTKVKFKTIIKISEKIKSHVEKEHVLPGSVTVDGVKYNYMQAGYLISKAVNNPGKDIELVTVAAAPNKSGETVDLKLTKAEYKEAAKILSDFIKSKKRLPNYLKFKGKKIKQRVFIYSFAKIIVWYNKNKNTLPGTCTFRTSETVAANKKSNTKSSTGCTNPYTSKPHYTDSGCNKLGQCTPFYCGPHSVHQGFRKFGVTNISEATIAGWAGTTTSGTDHDGLNTAIKKAAKKAGIEVDIKWYNFSDLGKTVKARFETLAKMICKKNVFAFTHIGYQCSGECSSGTVFGHYEMLDQIDVKNQKVRALNSLGNKCGSNSYCGHLQWRSYALEAHYISNISQKSICVVTKK